MILKAPYLIFSGNAQEPLEAKTARALVEWVPEKCAGFISLPDCRISFPVPRLSIQDALKQGIPSLVIGVTNRGGVLAPEWIPYFVEALEGGMNLINVLHQSAAEIPDLISAAHKGNSQIFDVRKASQTLPIGTGAKRTGNRLLTVGTDCSVGKMYTALKIYSAMKELGVQASFRATGQTGILIAGGGIPVDAVISDFLAGATETLSPSCPEDSWDIIEGQGSLFHPSFAGVSLGLLHGAQPDILILCHDPSRQKMRGVDTPLPDLLSCLNMNLSLGRVTNKNIKYLGISLNTSAYPGDKKESLCEQITSETGLPCFDPAKDDLKPLVRRLMTHDH